MGNNSINLSIFSVFLITSLLWVPAFSQDKCAISCKGSSSSPTFLNGQTYNYAVDGVVSILLSGADRQETSVKIHGQASVSPVGNCAYVLKVRDLTVSGPDGRKYSKLPGLEKPVKFYLENGRVGPEICAEEDDTRRSLNIKRAIISLLQTEQKPSTQVDFFGSCPTEVSSSQEGPAVLIHRTRDLSRCAHREQGKGGFIHAVYNPTTEVTNTQVLQSTMNIESKVNKGVPEKVAANEEYLYKPFSVGENGARASVQTKLTLIGSSGGAESAQRSSQSRTIIFENPHGSKMEQSNFQVAFNAVKETAQTLASEASSKSAGSFAQVIRIFRTVSKEDLLKIYNQLKGNKLEKRVFLDALLRTGTGYSIEASIQILKNKELNPMEQQVVYMSLGNARHVNDEALKAAASLLDVPNTPKEVYLGVGALAGAYCRSHFCHNTKSQGITVISQKFAAKLHNCKPKTKIEEDYIVAVLKGIRNIHHLEDNLIDKVAHCAADNAAKERARAAALEAFHADPCAAKLKKTALDLMKNRQLDSEIRIKAYLAVIECPNAKSATEIKNLLDTEPVHQVGRFISSSLRFIRASTNPDKQLARQHYGLIRTPNKFNVDDRKYSFYREASFNVDALGAGGIVEQTVIYSQDSFLPRSASLNLTAEVFGHSLNVLEIGGRQGNLDQVIEHFIGPKGLLRTESPQSIYDNLAKNFEEAKNQVDKIRGRRSVKTEIDSFDKRVKDEATPYNSELDLDLYLKLFGTDAVFLSFGDDKGLDFNKFLDQVFKTINGGIDELKRFQQDLRSHLLFLDAELAYPTSTGLPLKLDLIGSATGRLEAGTNIDIRQILRSPQNAKIDINLSPSTDIEIAGLFLVDADFVATGLKVVTNLHSSTGGHLIAKVLENGNGFDIQFALPKEKQEIITASNDLVFVTAEKGKKEKQTPLKIDNTNKLYKGCFDQLSGVIGLTLCSELSIPFSFGSQDAEKSFTKFLANYPLTGASKLELILEKNDLKGYHIKGLYHNTQERTGFELLLDAEGSQDRRTQLSAELVNSNNEKLITAQFKSGQNEIYGKVGFNVQGNDRRSVFKPVVEYKLFGATKTESPTINGQIIREINGPTIKYSLDGIKIYKDPNDPLEVNGYYKQEPKNVELELKGKQGNQNAMFSGSVKGNDVKLEFQNTMNPFINFNLNGHFEEGETIHNDIEFTYGPDLRNKENRITLNQLYKHHTKSWDDFSVISKNKLEIGLLPFKLKVDLEADPKKIDFEAETLYGNQKAEVDLEARTFIKKQGDYSIKLKAEAGNEAVELFAKRDIVSADKSNFQNYIQIKSVGKYELSGVVLHKTKPNDMNVGAIGHLKATAGGKTEDIKFDIGAIENANLYSSHAKVSGSKGELINYYLKVVPGANANGQLTLELKNTIAANGMFKVTDADGNGNGMFMIDFKQAQRKMKADVKFVAKQPVLNVDVDFFLNFEKDNNDKIHFSTKNKYTDVLLDSKNLFEYAGQRTELNINEEGKFGSGKNKANIEVVLPTERILTLKVNRELKENENVLNGDAEIILSDAPKRGGAASTITYKGKLTNTNYDKDVIDYQGQVDVKLSNGKQLRNSFLFKNIPQGDKFKFDFKTDLAGNLIPKPASLSAFVEYTKDYAEFDTIDGAENYRLKGNYGTDMSFELIGSDEVKLTEPGKKKYQEDNTLTIRLPFEKAHDIKIVSSVLYLQPDGEESPAEFTVIESVQFNGDVYKVDASGKVGPKSGFGKLKVLVPHIDPVSLDINYKADIESEEKGSGSAEAKVLYGKGKSLTLGFDATAAPRDYSFNIKVIAPEKVLNIGQKLELSVHTKNPTPDMYTSSILVQADGRLYYKEESQIVYSKSNPLLDITYSNGDSPKPSRIYLKGNYLSSNQGKSEIKIENVNNINFEASSEGNIQKDNVALKFQANSAELGLINYLFELATKDVNGVKRLEVQSTNNNKNIISGSISIISKQENNGKTNIIEGSGTVKYNEEQKPITYKYIRSLITEGKEQGSETFLNMAVGERSSVVEYRVTNLEYKYSYVYCEEKKQCAHATINSKVSSPEADGLLHSLNVEFDLRKLGIAPEFGLEVTNKATKQGFLNYNLNMHVNKEDKKYHLHVYSEPTYGRFPAGITITLPQRELALEFLATYPNKAVPFPIRGELAFYMDKKKPNQKTAARFLINFQNDDKQHTGTGVAEIGFSHPALKGETVLRFRGKTVQAQDNTYKIETLAALTVPNEKDIENKLVFEVSPVYVKLYASCPLTVLVDLEGRLTLKDNLQQGELKLSLLSGKPVQIRTVVKDFQYYEFTTGYTDESERKLSVVGRIDPEKRVDVSADIILPGEKKNIIHGALYLQDNLVKSDYGSSNENFNYFLGALKKDLETLEKRIAELGEKASNYIRESLQHFEPMYKKLETSFKADFQKLYNELAQDKTLDEIYVLLSDMARFFAHILVELTDAFSAIFSKVMETFKDTMQKVDQLYQKQLEPQLKEIYQNLSNSVKASLEGLLDVVAYYAAIVTDFFEKHKVDLEELTNTISEIFKDLTRLLVVQLKEIRVKISQYVAEISQQIKESPFITFIEQKFQDKEALKEELTNYFLKIRESLSFFFPYLPTQESQNFATALGDYILLKLRNPDSDDTKATRDLYEKLVLAVTSVVKYVYEYVPSPAGPSPAFDINPWFAEPSYPSWNTAPAFSPLNQFLGGEFPDVLSFIKAYRPRNWDPLDEVPARLRAVVVNGQHIFTFDGRHLTFPGNCRYVLAHDYVDRNFTLAMQLQNGAPKALIFMDKGGNTVEIKDNGQALWNGAAHSLPVFEKREVFAFRQTNGNIGIGSNYGFFAFCSPKLEVCYFKVSGFYLGKLRGLLGDGNNEPFDDFRMPNKKISTSESEFANAYRLATSCPQVKTPEHSEHQMHATLPPACEQVFGAATLKPLSLVLDVAPFRQACIHAATADSPDSLKQACDLAGGYVALAVGTLLPALMPPACVRCEVSGKSYALGDTYEIEVTTKQADIVVTVETTKSNEKNFKSLVVPLVGQLVNNLKSKQTNDIKVYLVGISSEMPYPLVYDTDVKLTNAKVVFNDDSRYDHIPTITTGFDNFDNIEKTLVGWADQLKIQLGLTNVMASYESVLELPLRAGAVKHTLSVVGDTCLPQAFFVQLINQITYSAVSQDGTHSHSLVTSAPFTSIGGGKNVANIVGFTSDSVLLLGDKKVKTNEELRSTLEVEHDQCVNFFKATNGFVFSAKNFHALNPAQQKQFLQTATSAISQKLIGESFTQECICSYASPFKATSYCATTQRKEVARRRK